MSTRCKIRIYKTCRRAIMTYAIRTREETAATNKFLRAIEMRRLRSISGYTLMDQKTNEFIWEQCNIQDIVRSEDKSAVKGSR